jgi:acetylornithine deacetylase/succinyl-diaminopimelate desuccinylase-like protein
MSPPSRAQALARAGDWFDSGALFEVLARRIAYRTESQLPDSATALSAYLADEITPALVRSGFEVHIRDNPRAGAPPMLIARRIEARGLPTVLVYGHGDVVPGHDTQWSAGLSPWSLTEVDGRWYGRGSADNKGQHSINLAALERVIEARGHLGFNVTVLLEMGEEVGSPGLKALCQRDAELLAADVLIASDGPRLSSQRPTLFLGSRGVLNFDLEVALREGAHHSGNWGGLLANPGTILANAIASLVDARGRIRVDALRPRAIEASVREALSRIEPGEPNGPAIDRDWGEPSLTPAERVFGWNALEVLAFTTGNPERPINAIPPRARATMQLRFVVGCDADAIVPAVQQHLDAHGFAAVRARATRMESMAATRLDPADPWVRWATDSIARTTGAAPAILPNLGGSLPNDCFADVLGLPTLWVPHSYPACSQHAPDEHMLATVAREGLAIMTGLFWDLGEASAPASLRRRATAPEAAGPSFGAA